MDSVRKQLFKELKQSIKEGGSILRAKKFQKRKAALLELFVTSEKEIDQWLLKPNKGFDGMRPIDISAKRFDRLICELREGPFS